MRGISWFEGVRITRMSWRGWEESTLPSFEGMKYRILKRRSPWYRGRWCRIPLWGGGGEYLWQVGRGARWHFLVCEEWDVWFGRKEWNSRRVCGGCSWFKGNKSSGVKLYILWVMRGGVSAVLLWATILTQCGPTLVLHRYTCPLPLVHRCVRCWESNSPASTSCPRTLINRPGNAAREKGIEREDRGLWSSDEWQDGGGRNVSLFYFIRYYIHLFLFWWVVVGKPREKCCLN